MKKVTIFFLFLLGFLTFPSKVLAVCPVCTVAVGAGLGISRALGIDDVVTSVWIGGLLLSISFWTSDWLKKKNFKFIKDLKEYTLVFISFILWTLLTLIPLYYSHLIGRVENTLWGVDKVILGTIVGSVVFLFAVLVDRKLRSVYGKQFFNYQKVVFPVVFLLITSTIMYLITR